MKSDKQSFYSQGKEAEVLLWYSVLRGGKMNGYQFKRQFPIKGYLADFICPDLKLIIKINGHSQFSASASDQKMRDHLEQTGYVLLKFAEEEIVDRLNDVRDEIRFTVEVLERNIKLPPG